MAARKKTPRARRGSRRRARVGQAKAITGNPFRALLQTIKQEVDTRQRGYLDAKLDAVEGYGTEVVEMVTAIRDLALRGGKRLRPALVVVGYRAGSAHGDIDPAIDAGVALELLHTYFLIHDDWIDNDDVRRGGPAVHAHLSRRFHSSELGCASAILAGDYAAALAVDAMSRVELPPARSTAILSCFSQMHMDAVLGQQLDLLGRAQSVELMYTLKTASYTVRGPLQLGALLAGASPRVLTALDRFSLPVGVAFQLRDDLLGTFGDPAETGKPRGSDLLSGKRTVLLNLALRRARGRDHRILKSVLGSGRASSAQLTAAIDVLERCGARAAVERRIEELVATARLALRAGRLGADARSLLEGAVVTLTERRH